MLRHETKSVEELITVALSTEERRILCEGNRLTFRVNSLSFYAEPERVGLAAIFESYLSGSHVLWSNLKARGTLSLLRTRREIADYRIDLEIAKVIPRSGERIEDYERSTLRPKSLSPRALEVRNIVSLEADLGEHERLTLQPAIHFCAEGGGKQAWSIQCYRESESPAH